MLNKRFRYTPHQTTLDAVTLMELRRAANHYASKATTDNTKRTYKAGQNQYIAFCEGLNKPVHPGDPEVVELFLAALAAQYKPSTIAARLSAIRNLYATSPIAQDPTHAPQVKRTFEGLMRTIDARQNVADAITPNELKRILNAWRASVNLHAPSRPLPRSVESPGSLRSCAASPASGCSAASPCPPCLRGESFAARNIALTTIGFAAALRRSELARLNWNNTTFHKNGVTFDLIHDKSQQRRYGRPITIHKGANPETCPVAALQHWRDTTIKLRGQATGPIFRAIHYTRKHGIALGAAIKPWQINAIIKKGADLAGLNHRNISAHSLRAGAITAMAQAGMTDRQTMEHSRHRSHAMITRYNRPMDTTFNATKAMGL